MPYPDSERRAFEELAGRVDPAALHELANPTPPRPERRPTELADGTFVYAPADPHFGVRGRDGRAVALDSPGVTAEQLCRLAEDR